MTELTVTKRKAIAREIHAVSDAPIRPELVQALVNRHQSTPEVITAFLESMGLQVLRLEMAPKRPATGPSPSRAVVPREIVSAVLAGSIYRILDRNPGMDPSKVFVVTTLDKFRREREAIRALLIGADVAAGDPDRQDSPPLG